MGVTVTVAGNVGAAVTMATVPVTGGRGTRADAAIAMGTMESGIGRGTHGDAPGSNLPSLWRQQAVRGAHQ